MLISRENSLLFTAGAGLIVLLVATQSGCNGHSGQPGAASMPLTSSSFSGVIPDRYACSRQNCPCDGQDISPELSWNSPPEHTRSFTLVVTDKDSFFGMGRLFGYFAHWVMYDIPAEKRELPEGVAKQRQFPDGSRQGVNGFDKIGYVGPCPPGHSSHRYLFTLYALDSKLNLPAKASPKQVLKAMQGHVLASGELVGRFPH